MIPPDFPRASSLEELCICMGVSSDKFREIISETNPSNLYLQHRIPKRGKTRTNCYRIAWESRNPGLSDLHKVLYLRLASFASMRCGYPHPCAHGYVRGRSTRTNADAHAGHKQLLRCDLTNFFPSISEARVMSLFLDLGFQAIPAELLARFATINGSLPLGLQSSPLIANLICYRLDNDMQEMAASHNLTYTRYADDISLSGDSISLGFADINEVVQRHGFTLSTDKFRITKRGQAHYVTGLSISDLSPRIPRQMKRRLRQELYYSQKYGVKEHLRKCSSTSYQSDINRITGMLSYLHSIEPVLAASLGGTWMRVLEREKLSQAYPPRYEKKPRILSYLIDETVIEIGHGRNLLALCCVVVEDESEICENVVALVKRYLLDPFRSGDRSVLESKGAHFTELSEGFRTEYLQEVASSPFRAYVIYDELGESDYEDKYLCLLSRLLTHRFIYSDRDRVVIAVEENPSVTTSKVVDLVRYAYTSLERKGSRRPMENPETISASKLGRPALSLSDAILWVFRSYARIEAAHGAKGHKKPGETNERRFESVRDKIRLIMSLVTAEKFTLNKPFYPWQDGDPFARRLSDYQSLAR